jgi:hypothetical protein
MHIYIHTHTHTHTQACSPIVSSPVSKRSLLLLLEMMTFSRTQCKAPPMCLHRYDVCVCVAVRRCSIIILMHAHTHALTLHTHTHTPCDYTHTHIRHTIHSQISPASRHRRLLQELVIPHADQNPLHVPKSPVTSVCVYACVESYVCMCMCMRVYICVNLYACMCMCMHVLPHTLYRTFHYTTLHYTALH